MSRITVDTILQVVAVDTGVSVDEMLSQSREWTYTRPRQRAYWLIRRLRPDMSLPRIARRLQRKDHTTVLHGIREMDRRIAENPYERALCERLYTRLTGPEAEELEALVTGQRVAATAAFMTGPGGLPPLEPADVRLLRAALARRSIVEAASYSHLGAIEARARLRRIAQLAAEVAGGTLTFPHVQPEEIAS